MLIFKIKYAILIVTLMSCGINPHVRPSNFAFTYEYGHGNAINTFDNTITKGLIKSGPETTSFRFSESQLDSIYQTMMDIGLLEYPDEFIPTDWEAPLRMNPPPSPERIMVRMGSSTRTVVWKEALLSTEPRAKSLNRLFKLIRTFVLESPEWKSLPPQDIILM